MHDLKISSKGFKIDSPQIFNMRVLIMSRPWDLFGLRLLMILNENHINVKDIIFTT